MKEEKNPGEVQLPPEINLNTLEECAGNFRGRAPGVRKAEDIFLRREVR